MKIYKKCLKRKGEKIANNMVMLNASANFIIFYFLYMTLNFLFYYVKVSAFCVLPKQGTSSGQ